MTHQTDILVIGSGIAGLFYALRVADTMRVTIVTKKQTVESNTNYAQGGIASVFGKDDSFHLHVDDTLIAGDGLCNRAAVDVIVHEGPPLVEELLRFGVEFTREGNHFDLGMEGGHSRNRIVHAKDLTGKEIEHALVARCAAHPNITIFENHLAIDLITEHQLIDPPENISNPIHCWGAYVFDDVTKSVKKFVASNTVLCTGGAGHVYLHTTNPSIATGDGVAMAYRAGAKISNMEFIQFHPTTLYHPEASSFLISEAVRGFGAILRNKDGERFMERYDVRKELAPRDIVARAIDSELKRRGEDCVYLDLTHLNAVEVKNHFPNIYQRCLSFKIDITKELVPVVPAAHYVCGGVLTDLYGHTSINQLYACGEVSMSGMHGANRLASNSLLEALVFAHRAAVDTTQRSVDRIDADLVRDWDDSGTFNNEEEVLISHNRREIQSVMWDYVGIVRSTLRLERALRRIELIEGESENYYKRTKITEMMIEVRNLATVASLIIRCALLRKESRGLHAMSDYPEKNDREYLHDTILVRNQG